MRLARMEKGKFDRGAIWISRTISAYVFLEPRSLSSRERCVESSSWECFFRMFFCSSRGFFGAKRSLYLHSMHMVQLHIPKSEKIP